MLNQAMQPNAGHATTTPISDFRSLTSDAMLALASGS